MQRGERPDLEVEHGKLLLELGEAEIWGWGAVAGKERVRRRVQWLTSVCGLRPGVRVLECGCGAGIFTRELAKTGAEISAVDISPDLLNRARELCQARNVTFLEADLEEPSAVPDREFEVLCGVSVLHHLKVAKALKVLKAKLKPEARFAFSEPNLLNPINKYYLFTPDLAKRRRRGVSPTEMAFHPVELRRLFAEAGYFVESLDMRDFLHPCTPEFLMSTVRVCETMAEALPLIRLWSGSIWISGKI